VGVQRGSLGICTVATQVIAIPSVSRHSACLLCTGSPRPKSPSTWAAKQAQNVGLVALSRLFHQAPCSQRHRHQSCFALSFVSNCQPNLGRRCFRTWPKPQSLATPHKPPYAALPTCCANRLGRVGGGRLRSPVHVAVERSSAYAVPSLFCVTRSARVAGAGCQRITSLIGVRGDRPLPRVRWLAVFFFSCPFVFLHLPRLSPPC